MLLDEIEEIFNTGVEGLNVLLDPEAGRVLLPAQEVVPVDLTFGLDELRTCTCPIALITFSPGDTGETRKFARAGASPLAALSARSENSLFFAGGHGEKSIARIDEDEVLGGS